jgi:hypothetical protein
VRKKKRNHATKNMENAWIFADVYMETWLLLCGKKKHPPYFVAPL